MTLTVKVDGNNITVNGANVKQADVLATNGVVHVIDAVLVPDGFVAPFNCGATQTIAELAVATPTLSTLVAALSATYLVDVFNGTAVFTVFAPTNEAFKKLGADLLTCLLDPTGLAKLTDVLKNHVVAGETLAADLSSDEKLTTLDNNMTLTVKVDGNNVSVNGANVKQADVLATNGVVHVIDAVLVPDGFVAPSCGASQ